jgi:RimJ/RimL family protein N-acetyltransferase
MSDEQPATANLTLISAEALEALLEGELDRARELTGLPLPPTFLNQGKFWRMRLDQIRAEPASARWLVRAIWGVPAEAVVGYAGFHGPPNENGMVEIGYTIEPEYRRQGYGRATANSLIDHARSSPEVKTVRASISPNNAASLALIRSLGFTQTGDQWDEEDGLELVFERAIR